MLGVWGAHSPSADGGICAVNQPDDIIPNPKKLSNTNEGETFPILVKNGQIIISEGW